MNRLMIAVGAATATMTPLEKRKKEYDRLMIAVGAATATALGPDTAKIEHRLMIAVGAATATVDGNLLPWWTATAS